MELQLTDEQQQLVASVSALVRREFGAVATAGDIGRSRVREHLPVLASSGFSGINMPTSIGGQGGGLLEAVLAIEAAAMINPVSGDAVQALNFGAIQQIARFGTADLRERFLAPCLRGDMLTAIAMTESEAGSAVAELRTTARIEGDDVHLNGSKTFTTHGPDADFFVVWARFGPERIDVGAVIVERDRPGFTVDGTNSFMSGEHYGSMYFDDAIVPIDNVLLDSDGFRRMLAVFNVERLGNASRSLALGQAAFDRAVDHAHDRMQFGKRLIDMQGLRWKLAEAALKLESARLLLYRAAANADVGLPSQTETAMAKLACNRAGFEAADTAVQVFGGSGFDAESLANYAFRRTRGWMIAGGTIEQMLDRIGRGLTRRVES